MEWPVTLGSGETLTLTVVAESGREDSLLLNDSAVGHLEAPLQLMEGHSYEYALEKGYSLSARTGGIVHPSRLKNGQGRITPGNYVGTLPLEVSDALGTKVGEVLLEVRSYKTSYREDYRHMLEFITERSTALILQYSSPVTQNLTVNYDADAETLYQRFAFVQSLLESREFKESVNRVVTMPVTTWRTETVERDIRKAGKMNSSAVRQLASRQNRMALPDGHALRTVMNSIPLRIPVTERRETVDTPENRFVKFALTGFMTFCTDIAERMKADSHAWRQANGLVQTIEGWLSHSLFKEVSQPSVIPLNSPVLQRKEGYREVLRAWLMFDLASKLIWEGGDDVYKAGKRDVAQLYEYWVFFKLLDIMEQKFSLAPKSLEELIQASENGLSLTLKSGIHTAIKGLYDSGKRKLKLKFSFNRSFSGKKDYPSGGSWTKTMRPDYTLSIWPDGMKEKEAEQQELIVHIHFDAKYRIENITQWFESDVEGETAVEKTAGSFKRDDLLKMHAYKDAIRRTGGAYVLYPGTEALARTGFHELVPGLGAFPLRPSADDGSGPLVRFIDDVIAHLLDRASQRERATYHSYAIHKDKPGNAVSEPLPERYGTERAEPVDETFVIVGMCKSQAQLDWIDKRLLYNARTGTVSGSIELGPQVTGAKYLVVRVTGSDEPNRIYRIERFPDRGVGPKIYSQDDLLKLKYPESFSAQQYCVFCLSKEVPSELSNCRWDIQSILEKHGRKGNQKGVPLAVSLRELMAAKLPDDTHASAPHG